MEASYWGPSWTSHHTSLLLAGSNPYPICCNKTKIVGIAFLSSELSQQVIKPEGLVGTPESALLVRVRVALESPTFVAHV